MPRVRPPLAGAIRRHDVPVDRTPGARQKLVERRPRPRSGIRVVGERHPGDECRPPQVLPGGDVVADYLTRLVERTLQFYPTVRPDIPPAFAPQTGGPMLREPQEEPAPDRHSPPRTTDRGEVPEEWYIVLRSTASDTSLQASNTGESAVIEPRPAGDEPPREPQEQRRRSSSAPPGPPVSDEAMEQHGRGPETSEIVPDRREATPTAFPTDIPA